MTRVQVEKIARLALTVRDLEATAAFYVNALGFSRSVHSGARRTVLRLGEQEIELEHRPDATPYPEPRGANDPWFQHFAIVVSDMGEAYAALAAHPHAPITRGGPQRLPPSTGSVIAYKFRDPEGHPLELLQIPGGAWSAEAQHSPGSVFLGIDHTALAVADIEASIAFYGAFGFAEGNCGLNRGREQERLDGLEDAHVDIVNLLPPGAGPHLELLHYRTPKPAPARPTALGDVAATRTVLEKRSEAAELAEARPMADPDGHWLSFTA